MVIISLHKYFKMYTWVGVQGKKSQPLSDVGTTVERPGKKSCVRSKMKWRLQSRPKYGHCAGTHHGAELKSCVICYNVICSRGVWEKASSCSKNLAFMTFTSITFFRDFAENSSMVSFKAKNFFMHVYSIIGFCRTKQEQKQSRENNRVFFRPPKPKKEAHFLSSSPRVRAITEEKTGDLKLNKILGIISESHLALEYSSVKCRSLIDDFGTLQ